MAGAASVAGRPAGGPRLAGSSLLKAAVLGADPNRRPVACAAGYAGAPLDPDLLDVTIGNLRCRTSRGLAAVYDAPAGRRRDARP